MIKTKEQLIQEAQALGIDTKGLTKTELENAIKALTPPASGNGGEKPGGEDPKNEGGNGEPGDTGSTATPEGKGDSSPVQPGEAVNPTVTTHTPNQEEEEEQEPPVASEPREYFEYNGSKYRFKKSAPERFNFLLQNKTKEEWLQDDDAMELLISGDSHLIIKIKE